MTSVHALVNCRSSSDDFDNFKFIVIEDRNQNFRLGEGDNNKDIIDSFSIPSPPKASRTSLRRRGVLRTTPEFATTGESVYCIIGKSNTHLYCIDDIHITDYLEWRRCYSLNVPKISPRLFAYNNMLYAFEAEFDFDHPPLKEGRRFMVGVKLDKIRCEPTHIAKQPAHHGNYLYILGEFSLFSYCLESRNWSVVDGFDIRKLSNYYPTSDTIMVEIVPLDNNKEFGATLFDPPSLTLYWTKFFISNPPQSGTDSPMAFNFTTPQISQFPWPPHPLFVIEHAKAACREHAKKRTISTAIQEKMKPFTDRSSNWRNISSLKYGGKLDLSLKQEEEIKSLKGVIKFVNSLSLDLNQTKQLQCLYEDLAELEDEGLKHTKEIELLKSTGAFVNPPQLSEFMEKQGGKQSSSYLKKIKKAIHEKRYTWIPKNIAKVKAEKRSTLTQARLGGSSSMKAQYDEKSLSLGTSLTALHVWINDLSKAVENGEELPPVLPPELPPVEWLILFLSVDGLRKQSRE
ncbi:hypothetical protein ACFE04_002119 [Oxalis oulophora]